jgi:hypothetical protein
VNDWCYCGRLCFLGLSSVVVVNERLWYYRMSYAAMVFTVRPGRSVSIHYHVVNNLASPWNWSGGSFLCWKGPTNPEGGGSPCMSVLPPVRSNFCGLGGDFCLKKREQIAPPPPETSTLPQLAPSIYFSDFFYIKAMNFQSFPAQPQYTDATGLYTSPGTSRLMALLSCP